MNILSSIFTDGLTLSKFLIVIFVSMFLGFLVSLFYMFKSGHTKTFVLALILIPAIESVVIMLVNDNFGVGLSVAGSFALIRFRSIKGDAKDLACIFFAMTIGIIAGTGYVVLAGIFTVALLLVAFVLSLFNFGKESEMRRYLKITIPESLDYEKVFDDILNKYTKSYTLETVKTLNLGSLFRVEYQIDLKDSKRIKKMIDELRTRNSNLEISLTRVSNVKEEL